MHHVAEPEAVRKTLTEMVRVTRSRRAGAGLGPQPAQPLLEDC